MRCWLHTTLTPTPILNPTVTLIYTPTPPATQHYPILPPQLSSTVNPTLTRTLTLNFMPTTPQPAQPHLQPIPPALVLCQSCLDPSHNPKLLPNPTSNPNSFGESGFGETGFGEPEGHPLVVVSIGQYKWFSVSIPVRYSHWTMVNHNQLHQHGGTPLVVESRSGESESKSESPTGESESESESPKNGTRVGLESESRVRVLQLCPTQPTKMHIQLYNCFERCCLKLNYIKYYA